MSSQEGELGHKNDFPDSSLTVREKTGDGPPLNVAFDRAEGLAIHFTFTEADIRAFEIRITA